MRRMVHLHMNNTSVHRVLTQQLISATRKVPTSPHVTVSQAYHKGHGKADASSAPDEACVNGQLSHLLRGSLCHDSLGHTGSGRHGEWLAPVTSWVVCVRPADDHSMHRGTVRCNADARSARGMQSILSATGASALGEPLLCAQTVNAAKRRSTSRLCGRHLGHIGGSSHASRDGGCHGAAVCARGVIADVLNVQTQQKSSAGYTPSW